MKTYNVGIIGLGFIGKVHTCGYENLKYYYPDRRFRVKLFGVCEGSGAILEKLKQDFSFSFYTTDYKALINHPEIDAVDICTPNALHKEQLLEAIKAGKHIYCEKPLVPDFKSSKEVIQALKGFNGVHQVSFHNRFYPSSIKTRELIDSGKLGKPVSFRIAYYHSGSIEKEKPMGWKQEKGAGVALDLGSHVIDLMYFFWGEFAAVSAATKILYPERRNKEGKTVKVEVEDYFSCHARLKNGPIGNIDASKVAAGTQDELSYELYGTEGALRYNSMEPNYLQYYDQRKPDAGFQNIPTVSRYKESSFPGPKFALGWIRGHIHSIYEFLCSVDKGADAAPSFYDGHYNMRVLETARLSEEKKGWVTVADE